MNNKPFMEAWREFEPHWKRHIAITSALFETAELRRKVQPTLDKSAPLVTLPKAHPVYAIALKDFGDLVAKHAPDGELDYLALIKIQVASTKCLGPEGFKFLQSFLLKYHKSSSEPIAHDPTRAVFKYEFICDDPNPFFTIQQKEAWVAGFKEGVAKSKRMQMKSPTPPDQTMRRSPHFWTTYEAWLMRLTDHAARKQRNGLSNLDQIVAFLRDIGVTEEGVYLVFPTDGKGDPKMIKLRTLGDNLTDWQKEFRGMAQIPTGYGPNPEIAL